MAMNPMYDEFECAISEWNVSFTATSNIHEIDWELFVDNSTCMFMISVALFEIKDDGYMHNVGMNFFNFEQPDCQFSLPVEITVDYVPGSSNGTDYYYSGITIESIPLELLMNDDICNGIDEDSPEFMVCLNGFVTFGSDDPEPSFIVNMSDLETGKSYILEIEVFDLMHEMNDGADGVEWDSYQWCGWEVESNYGDYEDNTWWCGDEEGDAEDWWYYCEWQEDEVSMWQCTDDFGQDDSYGNTSGNNYDGTNTVWHYFFNATSNTESYQMSIPYNSCLSVLEIELVEENGSFAGLFVALLHGTDYSVDDNANDIPDCLEFDGTGGPGGLPEMGSQYGHLSMGYENPDWGFMQEVYPFDYMQANVVYNMTIIAEDLMEEEYVLSTRSASFGEVILETNETVFAEDGMLMYNFTMEYSEWDCLIDTEVILLDSYGEERIDQYRMLMSGPCQGGSIYGHISATVDGENLAEYVPSGEHIVDVQIDDVLVIGEDYQINAVYLPRVSNAYELAMNMFGPGLEQNQLQMNFTANSTSESFSMPLELFDSCTAFIGLQLVHTSDSSEYEIIDIAYSFLITDPCGEDDYDDFNPFDLLDAATEFRFI